MTKRFINVRKIILKENQDCARKRVGSVYFPSLITSLCFRAQVKTKTNLKGCYVPGCITRHDIERLVENVRLLNQIEPNELETDESLTKSKPEADLINKTKG
ncbi:hypothetical protein J1N35_023205 [Gossypium stocksii]|uniref:Uncharacterized protein n=1 Tax=Gossypium stocksii TaxID=47602 RepID=A0A9D3VJ63_9ROSI|nr:hypothetical protein J1N35_023205 [Gossypium stocksii]